jgi:hypothetical protein
MTHTVFNPSLRSFSFLHPYALSELRAADTLRDISFFNGIKLSTGTTWSGSHAEANSIPTLVCYNSTWRRSVSGLYTRDAYFQAEKTLTKFQGNSLKIEIYLNDN